MSRYAFYFDSSGCSGCKACQVACKDRNGLEVGLLWRRVYEVSGGSWERQGEAWAANVYAYNLSVACNHCERAVCAEACPTQAIFQREDGIVLIDAERCIGCKYCSWACPYGAPQYDWHSKSMTKCTFCVEDVEAGLAPACVAACPLRVLDFGEREELRRGEAVQSIAPLPEAGMTRPALFIQPHRDAGRQEGRVANREEVRTGKKGSELPLVIFTVLAQMAVGAFIVLGAFTGWAVSGWVVDISSNFDSARLLALLMLLATGMIFASGLLASLYHLGHPSKAYRALANLRTSWLSREILLASIFGSGLAVICVLAGGFPVYTSSLRAVFGLTALAGLALIYCMARVYRLDSLPAWNNWLTPVSFFLTAATLGFLFIGALIAPQIRFGDLLATRAEKIFSYGMMLVLLLLAVDLAWRNRQAASSRHIFWPDQLRLAFDVAAMLPLAVILVSGWEMRSKAGLALSFGLALGAQIIGRWQFYERLNEREL